MLGYLLANEAGPLTLLTPPVGVFKTHLSESRMLPLEPGKTKNNEYRMFRLRRCCEIC